MVLYFGDSNEISIPDQEIDFLLTCPPYYHPKNKNESKFGKSPDKDDLEGYVVEIGDILKKWYLKMSTKGMMALVKTDFWFENQTYLVGFELTRYLQSKDIPLHRHWIWQHSLSYSPYSPSFANIFVFGKEKSSKTFDGIIKFPKGRNKVSSLHYLDVYKFLIESFTERNELVFDPFAGTGSVLKAAYLTGRGSLGIEIDKNQLNKAKLLLKETPLEIII